MASDLRGKTAVVTGAARGIGRGIALALAEAGANVVLADLDRDAGEMGYALSGAEELARTTQEVAAAGPGAIAVGCDVTSESDVAAMVARACDQFGGIDLLVNNAGVVHFAPVEQLDPATWDRVYAVNVKGAFLCSRAALPSLRTREGNVVNIASVAGKRGYALGSLYCSSKFALIGLTQSLAHEWGPRGVRANAVCPGILNTHMWSEHLSSAERGGEAAYQSAVASQIPLGRDQTPQDIAEAVLYLATATNVTGIALNVAGGMEVW